MIRPERRTRGDLIAAGAIVAVVAVVAALFWWTSDSRHTVSDPADVELTTPVAAGAVPTAVHELWHADSPVTTMPVVAGGAVITASGSAMTGRDPVTGNVAWTYARDLPLCGVSSVYHWAVAVYPDSRGCGQVSAINGSTGRRGPTRTGYADKQVTLSTDGSTVLAAGSTRIEQWRSDLVRTIAFGETDARYKPAHVGLGKGCTLLSAAGESQQVSVLQACPDKADVKVTLVKAADQDDEPTLIDVPEAGISAASGARIVAVSGGATAVYLPSPKPRLSILNDSGKETASVLLDGPAAPLGPPGTETASTAKSGDVVTWWTGRSVVVLAADGLRYRYSVTASGPDVPLGPGTTMAGKLLIPHTGGIGVYDTKTGAKQRFLPVARPAVDSAVGLKAMGSTIIEQRGDTVVGLG